MSIGITTTSRDAVAGTTVPAPPVPVPAPRQSAVPQDDAFGPATRVEISASEKPAAPEGKTTELQIEIDADTKTIVYQSKDPTTGAVVYQFPDEAKMRLRAYLDDLSAHQTATATAGTHPDPSTIDSIRV